MIRLPRRSQSVESGVVQIACLGPGELNVTQTHQKGGKKEKCRKKVRQVPIIKPLLQKIAFLWPLSKTGCFCKRALEKVSISHLLYEKIPCTQNVSFLASTSREVISLGGGGETKKLSIIVQIFNIYYY